jgi:hypothetical protein
MIIQQNVLISVLHELEGGWYATEHMKKAIAKKFGKDLIQLNEHNHDAFQLILTSGFEWTNNHEATLRKLRNEAETHAAIENAEATKQYELGEDQRAAFEAWAAVVLEATTGYPIYMEYGLGRPHDEVVVWGHCVVPHPYGGDGIMCQDPTCGDIALIHNRFIAEDEDGWDHVYLEDIEVKGKDSDGRTVISLVTGS